MRSAIAFTVVLSVIGILALPLHAQTDEPEVDPWTPLRPLLGTWSGVEVGNETGSRIQRTYELVMGGKFVRSTTSAAFDPSEADANGDLHQDVGFFSYDPARESILLREFMSEGYVVTYVLERATPESLVLVSENSEGAGGYGARLRYSLLDEDGHLEELDLAPPGKGFFTCHRMKMTRSVEE